MMKSFVFPARKPSFLFPNIDFSPLKSPSFVSNFLSVRKPDFLCGLRSRRLSLSSFSPGADGNGHCYQTEGEIHVIVGPMFAGKTTTLLRRIESESSNGRFQARVPNDVVSTDETLKNLCFSGRLTEAVRLLCHTGHQVDSETYSLLLQDCIFKKHYQLGRRIHSQMMMTAFVPNTYLKIKLLILYAKSGDLLTAHIIFNKLVMPNVISWNAMIAGYVQKGLEEIGLNLYDEMRQSGLTPDQFTFASVFRACATLAKLEKGKQAHGVLIKNHISGNVVVNSALIDMYFKCSCSYDGHLVFNKSYDKNVITWTSLISGYGQHGRVKEACKIYGNMDMMKIAAKNYFELETDNVGKYIILSNAFATFDQWSNVAELRSGLKELGVKKEPGYSMVEVQRNVHFFFMGHNTHEQTDLIYEVIKDMNCILKDAGYIPDFTVTCS
ncbi:hypothetical protein R6Q57_028753 [Mikania cordata]